MPRTHQQHVSDVVRAVKQLTNAFASVQAEMVVLEGKLAESSGEVARLSNARAALELAISKAEDSGFALSQRKQALLLQLNS